MFIVVLALWRRTRRLPSRRGRSAVEGRLGAAGSWRAVAALALRGRSAAGIALFPSTFVLSSTSAFQRHRREGPVSESLDSEGHLLRADEAAGRGGSPGPDDDALGEPGTAPWLRAESTAGGQREDRGAGWPQTEPVATLLQALSCDNRIPGSMILSH